MTSLSNPMHRALMAGLLLALWPASPLAAQTPAEAGAADAPLRLGPLALDPRIALRNLGVDTNALNDASSPTRDLTATIGPELDAWLRVGRLHVASQSKVDWNYFQALTSQRSLDLSEEGRIDLALEYIVPHVSGRYLRTRQRPNLEIDGRVERLITGAAAGVQLNAGAKLSVDLAHERRTIDFGDASFAGVGLAPALNRRERETTLTARYALTPLTTVVIKAVHERDRFEFSPARDTDSIALLPGLELKPLALVAGSVTVGVRQFRSTSGALPRFTGLVSDLDLRYQAGELVRFDVGFDRDLEYSFEPLEPYYLSSGVNLGVTQALGASWDAVLRVTRTTLDYRAWTGDALTAVAASRLDTVRSVGGGIGRRLAEAVRVGVDVDRVERRSSAAGRSYEGLRVGGSVTYGF
jgi:hypothetical protein